MNVTDTVHSATHSDETDEALLALMHALLMRHATMQAELQSAKAELRGIHELTANGALSAADKVLAILALEHVGAAPGRPSPYRLTEYVPVTVGEIASKMGMGAKQVGARLRGFSDARLLRVERYTTRGDDGLPRKHIRIAPPDGADWEATWARPARIGPIESPALARDAKRKAEEREREREHVRAILAQCPECGSTSLDMRCHICGTITPVDDMPDAPDQSASSQKAESAHMVRGCNREESAPWD